jgi:hypothetical protein
MAGTTEPDPTFRLRRFNPRRTVRGCADVLVMWADGTRDQLWMTLEDVKANIVEFGRDAGLVNALEAYKAGVEITFEEAERRLADATSRNNPDV